jgi:hypothetical protein
MTYDEILTVVRHSSKLRMPGFQPDDRTSVRIEALADHMLACATNRGMLEEVWQWASRLVTNLEEQGLEGEYEVEGKTAAERSACRMRLNPEVFGALRDARQAKADIERQIRRLEKDEATASRAYTFITGN